MRLDTLIKMRIEWNSYELISINSRNTEGKIRLRNIFGLLARTVKVEGQAGWGGCVWGWCGGCWPGGFRWGEMPAGGVQGEKHVAWQQPAGGLQVRGNYFLGGKFNTIMRCPTLYKIYDFVAGHTFWTWLCTLTTITWPHRFRRVHGVGGFFSLRSSLTFLRRPGLTQGVARLNLVTLTSIAMVIWSPFGMGEKSDFTTPLLFSPR